MKPDYFAEDQMVPASVISDEALKSILKEGEYVIDDGWDIGCQVIEKRIIKHPFYKNTNQIDLKMVLPFEEGTVIGSWLAVDFGRNSPKDGPSLFRLHGKSPPIHEINAKLPISLDDDDTAARYLRFFCAHVWGDAGGFWVVSDIEDIPFVSTEARAEAAADLQTIAAPKFKGRNSEGHFLFSAHIMHGSAIFEGEFEVVESGMVNMIDDRLVAKNIRRIEDERISGFRLFKTP